MKKWTQFFNTLKVPLKIYYYYYYYFYCIYIYIFYKKTLLSKLLKKNYIK